jgi:uncharacterized membrane protein HdeD (DUF308 family)
MRLRARQPSAGMTTAPVARKGGMKMKRDAAIIEKNWWSLVIRGVAAIAMGLVALLRHGVSLDQLVVLFFAYALFDGLAGIAGAIRAAQGHERSGMLLIEGLAGVATAMVTIAWPAITALSFMHIIAGWAMVTGVLEIAAAVSLRKSIAGEWLLGLSGFASLILGVVMLAMPLAPVGIALWIGGYALIFGVLVLELGWRLRSRARAGARDPRPIGWQRG